ncbi:MAG TPA: FTR1 family protein [Pseudomonadales bacterium]
MLIHAVVIFFQEVFEASLLTGLLLTLASQQRLPLRWLWQAFVFGILGAATYAGKLQQVSAWFDYAGQELVNALLQTGIFACLLLLLLFDPSPGRRPLLSPLMSSALALAIIMEGAEIVIYLQGATHHTEQLLAIGSGAVLGSAIGASFAALIYYALVRYPGREAWLATRLLLCLTAAAMLGQASQQLVQADWLAGGPRVWDSSSLVDEQSLAGHFLYALLGYEATPDVAQLVAWLAGLLATLLVTGRHWLAGLRPGSIR